MNLWLISLLGMCALLLNCGGSTRTSSETSATSGGGGASTGASSTSAGKGTSSAGATSSGGNTSSNATTSNATTGSTAGACSSTTYDGTGPVDGLILCQPLALSAPAIGPGQTLTGTATLMNVGTAAVTLMEAAAGLRPPGGTNQGGPFYNLTYSGAITIPAGGTYAYTGTWTVTAEDPTGQWYAYFTFEDQTSTWHDSPVDLNFNVVAASGSTTSGSTSGSGSTGGSTTSGASSTTGSSGGALPYMIGYGGGDTSDAQIAAFEAMLGRPMNLVTDGQGLQGFQFGPYSSSNGRAVGKIITVEMLSESFDGDQSLVDMGVAADGGYDDVYTQAAQAMAAFGDPQVAARIGWEMSGDWYPWSAYTGNSTANATTQNYIATFRRVAQIVRKYNPNTLIEWCTNISPPGGSTWPDSNATPPDYWVGAYDPVSNPGGADVISMDIYQGDNYSNFSDVLDAQFGLNWLAQFAQQNGVLVALSEDATGLSNSNGEGSGCPCSNDAVWMQGLVDWIESLPPGVFNHFVYSPWEPADDLLSSSNSAIQQVWISTWGQTYFSGAWWKGPKVPSQP